MTTATELERRFADDRLPEELRRSVVCTELALYVAEQTGGEVWGFWSYDNPAAQVATVQAGYDGHDFAVVGGRFIVDIWARDVEMNSPRAVFDMEAPADAAEIARLYGERAKWVRNGLAGPWEEDKDV